MVRCLRVSRETQPDDVAEGLELSLQGCLVGVEAQIGNENGVRLRGFLVTIGLGTVLTGSGLGAGGGEINIKCAAIKFLAVHSLESSLGRRSLFIFNVSETAVIKLLDS